MTTTPIKTIVLDLLQHGFINEVAWTQELTATDRAAVGTSYLWSARDHVIHRTFGRQNLLRVLTAIFQHQEIPSREKINDEINAEVFAEQRLRPWSAIYAEAEIVDADLIRLIEHLSEDELMETYPAITSSGPLYAAFLGYCYEHGQEHIVQYYSDRNDLMRAIAIREQCANRVLEVEVPDWVKGWFLYNVACFYVAQNQLKNAVTRLQQAATLHPQLQEQAKHDPELAAIHDQLP